MCEYYTAKTINGTICLLWHTSKGIFVFKYNKAGKCFDFLAKL